MGKNDQDPSAQDTPPTTTDVNEPVQSETVPTTKTDTVQTFTQEDVTRIAAKEKREGKLSATKDLLAELGIENVDEIKTMLSDAKKRKDEGLSELEKMTSSLETMTTERDTANTKLAEQMATLLQDKRNRFVRKALLAGGAKENEVDDLLILVDSKMASDKSSLFSDNESEADKTKLDPFVKQVQSQLGSYFGTAGAGSPAILGRNPSAAVNKEEATLAYMNRIRGR